MNLLKQEGYDLMACAFEVYNTLGPGFLEEVYHEALMIELTHKGLSFDTKQEISIVYKDVILNKKYIPDLFVEGGIVVELKAVKTLADEHTAQLMNYMKVINYKVGYLINFASPQELQWKRFIV
jgi:GxxExxY protein